MELSAKNLTAESCQLFSQKKLHICLSYEYTSGYHIPFFYKISFVMPGKLYHKKHTKIKIKWCNTETLKTMIIASAQNTKRFEMACVLLRFVTLPALSGILGDSEEKRILHTNELRWPWRLTALFFHYTVHFFSLTEHFLNIIVHFLILRTS